MNAPARTVLELRGEMEWQYASHNQNIGCSRLLQQVSAKPRLGGSWHTREDTVWATTSPLEILTVAAFAAAFMLTDTGQSGGCLREVSATARTRSHSPSRCSVHVLGQRLGRKSALEDRAYMRLPGTPFRVLVADDFIPWRLYVCQILQSHSLQWQIVGQASDGLEAVKQTAELHPDIVLLDVGMPSLDGIEAAKQIRKADRRTKILFLTMNNDLDVKEAAHNIGADGYVLKTKAGGQLLPAMERAMRSVFQDQETYL